MNTHNQIPSTHLAVQQSNHNATSFLGHRMGDHRETAMGQTFVASSDGVLENIEVFSSIVANPGQVIMTLHAFDPQSQSWGPALGSAAVAFSKSDNDKWVAFQIPGLRLTKGLSYGFRLQSHDSYVGVGEAAGSAGNPPYSFGKEWKFNAKDEKGDAFAYFSLAFKVGLKAA